MWVNPPWSLQQRALEKVLVDVPCEFVMLGVLSKKPWATSLHAMGCLECVLPKSVGNGFFTQLLSNGEYKPLRFPIWDLVAFYGTREQILLHKRASLDAIEPLGVTAVTTTPTASSSASENYLNVNYAPSLTLPQLAEAKEQEVQRRF